MNFPAVFEEALEIIMMLNSIRGSEAKPNEIQMVTSKVVADTLGVSEAYARKTIRKLVLAGIVYSKTGPFGGIGLRRSLADLTLFDVYEAVVSDVNDVSRNLELQGYGTNMAYEGVSENFYGVLSAIQNAAYDYMKTISLNELPNRKS